MKLNPYLMFDGDCRQAFTFYEQVLGGRIVEIMDYAQAPAEAGIPERDHQRVMHVTLELDGSLLMGSDHAGEYTYEGIRGASVTLGLDDPQRAREIFARLSENGNVQMPIEQTFWARAFGVVVDRFGVSWMVNCE